VLAGFALTARWYIDWLYWHWPWSESAYLFPRGIGAFFLGIISSPLIPLVVFLEWAWHGWPSEINWGFASWVLGYALLFAGRKREPGSPYASDN